MSRWLVVHESKDRHTLPSVQFVEGADARQAAFNYDETELENGDTLYVVARGQATAFVASVTPAVVDLTESRG